MLVERSTNSEDAVRMASNGEFHGNQTKRSRGRGDDWHRGVEAGAAIAMDYDRVNNDDVGSSSSKVPFFSFISCYSMTDELRVCATRRRIQRRSMRLGAVSTDCWSVDDFENETATEIEAGLIADCCDDLSETDDTDDADDADDTEHAEGERLTLKRRDVVRFGPICQGTDVAECTHSRTGRRRLWTVLIVAFTVQSIPRR